MWWVGRARRRERSSLVKRWLENLRGRLARGATGVRLDFYSQGASHDQQGVH